MSKVQIYEPENNLLIVIWSDNVNDILMTCFYVHIRVFANKNDWKIIKYLVNISKLENNFHQNEWFVKIYFSKLVENGLKYSATIDSKSYFLNADEHKKITDIFHNNQKFFSYEEAYQWIITQ